MRSLLPIPTSSRLPRASSLRLAIAAGLAALPMTVADAFDAADRDLLLATGSCPGCDLRGADLTGARLVGADLRGADLRGAALDTASLDRAVLRGADLGGATGSFVGLAEADLSGVRLAGFRACYDQDFSGALLRGADLTGAELCATIWFRADLAGADLSGADLTYAIALEQAQLDTACGDMLTRLPPGLTVAPCAAASPE